MPDGLPVFGFAPAIKIIGRTIGKIFNRLYTVFTEGDEHSRRYTWNILESVFNAKLLSLSIKIRPNAPLMSVEALTLALSPFDAGQRV